MTAFGFPPPWPYVKPAAKLAALLLIPTVALYFVFGPAVATIAAIAATGAPLVPVTRARLALALYAGLACFALIASLYHLELWPITILVALAAAATGIASTISASAFTGAPAIAMIIGGNSFDVDPALAAIITFAVGAYLVFLVRLMHLTAPPQPVAKRVAAIHALVMAVMCGATAWLYLNYQLPHGYWLVLTLAFILRPTVRETATMTRHRVVGTLLGGLVAVLISPLPTLVLLGFVFACIVFMISYALMVDFMRSILFTTPVVLVLATLGTGADAIGLTLERLIWTFLGCAIGGSLALALARFDRKEFPPATTTAA